MLKFDDITEAVVKYNPKADLDIIYKAYLFSAKVHRGQSRVSGEAYISHPLEVAYNLTKLKMDEVTVAAGLLHDTIEDTIASKDEILGLFGEEMYQLVDGVTKIGKIEFASKEEKQAENFRKMILAMSKDIRVILIKLADRAHNLRTLDSMSEEAQKRIAGETLDIFAPLANRLGIGWLKAELENGSFKYLHPDEWRTMEREVAQGEEQREKYVRKACEAVSEELRKAQIRGCVLGRPKHLYSIYKKMQDRDIDFHDICDLIGVRVVTDTVKDCYAILGLMHSLWKPVPGKFKDYIAMPKHNMYQSLHTTVMGPEGQRVEVQIRTEEMHRIGEEGIAAHWQYKEGGGGGPRKMDDQLLWVRHLLESQSELKNPKEFLDAFKVDLYPHEVYVFTPQGDVLALPKGASPIDFAYQVHTDIGHHCREAKVNGRIVPLRYKLRNGDRVEILTSKQKGPSRDWLAFVKTSKARSKILSFINSEEKTRNLDCGRAALENELLKYDPNPAALLKGRALENVMHACGFNTLDSFFVAIGMGKVTALHVAEKIVPREKLESRANQEPVPRKESGKKPSRRSELGIRVSGLGDDNVLLRMGKCCTPVPGDKIIGYITRGRGVSIHTEDCPSVNGFVGETERILQVEWDSVKKIAYPVRISIVTTDKPGMLATISGVLASCNINITRATVTQGAHKRAYFDFSTEIYDLGHLTQTILALGKVDGVIHVERVKEYQKKISGKSEKGQHEDSLIES